MGSCRRLPTCARRARHPHCLPRPHPVQGCTKAEKAKTTAEARAAARAELQQVATGDAS